MDTKTNIRCNKHDRCELAESLITRQHFWHNTSEPSAKVRNEIHFEMERRCENLAGSYFLFIFPNNISQKRTGIKSFYFLKSVI